MVRKPHIQTAVAMADEEFEEASSGASQTFPLQCSSLRKNGNVMIKSHPCKIVEMSTSKTGKHGHAKVHLVGIEIFTGKKYEDICPSTHNMLVPNVTRTEFQVLAIDEDEFYCLMNTDGDLKEDLKFNSHCGLPLDDIKNMIDEAENKSMTLQATVVAAVGEEMVTGFKIVKNT